jgi:hypothetical protein
MRATLPGLAAEKGWQVERYTKGFAELSSKGMAKHDAEAAFLWLPKFIRYNAPENPNVLKAWGAAIDLLPECALRAEAIEAVAVFAKGLPESFQEALPEPFQKSIRKPEPEPEPKPKPQNRAAGASPRAPREGEKSMSAKAFDAYSEAFQKRYRVAPLANAKIRGQFTNLVAQLGECAIDVARFYVTHDRKLYLEAKHPVELLLRDCAALRTDFMRSTGRTSEEWWKNSRGVKAKGAELNVAFREGETFPMYEARVYRAAGEGPWLKKVDPLIAQYMQALERQEEAAA